MSTTGDPQESKGGANPLEELLACEQELADKLERARAAARKLVEETRSEVARARAELEASLEAESERVRARIHAETQSSVRALSARARERVARYDGVSEERVAELGAVAFRRLIGAKESP